MRVTSLGEAMRQRDKVPKTRRHKRLTPKRRSASNAQQGNKFPPPEEGKKMLRALAVS